MADVLFNLLPPTCHMLEGGGTEERRWALFCILHLPGAGPAYIETETGSRNLWNVKPREQAGPFVLSGTVQSGIGRLTWQYSQNPVPRCSDSDPTFSIYVPSELLEILELCSKPAWGLWDPTANFMIVWAPASNWLHSKPPCTSCVTTCGKPITSGSLGFLIFKMKCKQ